MSLGPPSPVCVSVVASAVCGAAGLPLCVCVCCCALGPHRQWGVADAASDLRATGLWTACAEVSELGSVRGVERRNSVHWAGVHGGGGDRGRRLGCLPVTQGRPLAAFWTRV
jgi:hypothetical protein